MHDAFTAAGSSHRGPVFVDVPMDEFFNSASGPLPPARRSRGAEPDGDAVAEVAELLASRVATGADPRHRRLGRRRRGGRAALRRVRRHPDASPTAWAAASSRAATRCWSPRPAARRSAAATSSSWSAPRSTSGSGTASSAARTAPRRRRSCTSPTPPARSPGTPTLAASVAGDLTAVLDGLLAALEQVVRRPDWSAWVDDLQATVKTAAERDAALLERRGRPDPPGPDLRRAGAPAGRGRRRDRRRRRLRQLRRQVRRAEAARRLARPRPLRLPRRRPRLGHRGPARPAVRRRWCCCSATAPPASR